MPCGSQDAGPTNAPLSAVCSGQDASATPRPSCPPSDGWAGAGLALGSTLASLRLASDPEGQGVADSERPQARGQDRRTHVSAAGPSGLERAGSPQTGPWPTPTRNPGSERTRAVSDAASSAPAHSAGSRRCPPPRPGPWTLMTAWHPPTRPGRGAGHLPLGAIRARGPETLSSGLPPGDPGSPPCSDTAAAGKVLLLSPARPRSEDLACEALQTSAWSSPQLHAQRKPSGHAAAPDP